MHVATLLFAKGEKTHCWQKKRGRQLLLLVLPDKGMGSEPQHSSGRSGGPIAWKENRLNCAMWAWDWYKTFYVTVIWECKSSDIVQCDTCFKLNWYCGILLSITGHGGITVLFKTVFLKCWWYWLLVTLSMKYLKTLNFLFGIFFTL